jgi:D-alanine-D-alanine ligase-like ATP-grasp enzyme
MPELRSKPHHAYTTRLLIMLYNEGKLPNIASIEVEPSYGHVGRIVYRNGQIRLYRGGRTGINAHGSSLIAKDKGYSKYFLRSLGYVTPDWATFITEDYAQRINMMLQTRGKTADETPEEALAYVKNDIGYPCYLKPNEGSQGRGVYRCETDDDVMVAIEDFRQQKVDVFILEKAINLPDYRVVIFDGECVAAYARRPLAIIGDGQRSIAHLLDDLRQAGIKQERKMLVDLSDTRIQAHIRKAGYTPDSILSKGDRLQLHDVANLSLGGAMEDYSDKIHPHWKTLCAHITRDMGLRLCGIDLACGDITQANADYSIIEINASPGLENYATLGTMQQEKVHSLYQRIFNEMPVGASVESEQHD